jgi:SAM-dependent methyltransferase
MHDEQRTDYSKTDGGDGAAENAASDSADARPSIRALYMGIFLTSAAVILLEISLTRVFSYTIWYHFTYVTISLAMLGFGASGAVLASSEKLAGLDMKLAQRSALIGAVSIPVMLVVISKVPFYPFQLFQEPVQIIYMLIYYVTVTLPFFCAGLAISCIFRSIPQQADKIYFGDLLGAGAGCLVVVGAINIFGVPAITAMGVSLFLLASAMFVGPKSVRIKYLLVAAALVWMPMGTNIEKALDFKPSKEKWMSKMPDKKITYSKWSPIFRVDAYDMSENMWNVLSPDWSIYGIKNKYMDPDARYSFIAHDGDACTMMVKSDAGLSNWDMFDKSILKPPYLLTKNPKVLVIGPGGGVDVATAVHNKATSVLAVELDPITVDLVSNKYADFVGHLYDKPEVDVVVDEGRSFLRRSEQEFDLIQMTGVDTLAALTSGAYVLAENYLYTTEGYKEFLDHLTPDGVLSVAIFDYHYKFQFPRHAARQVSLSVETLEMMGIEKPQEHIAVIATSQMLHGEQSIPHVIIMTKKSPFTLPEIGRLTRFAEEVEYDIWHLPDESRNNPCAYIATASEEQRAAYYDDHFFKLTAPTDDTPFFFHYFKWPALLKEYDIDTGHTGATGQLILLLILIFSIIFSVALIVFPLLRIRGAGLKTKWKWHYILYFAALGLGFIFLEISYIQRFILFLGYPTYSLTVILFSLLTFSGVGSYISGRLRLSPRNLIFIAFGLLAFIALGYMALLPPIFNHFLGASMQARIAISLVLLLPMGLLLGVFFPTGIKIISAENKRFIPWAWGINGCASVIGTVLSIIIAMSHGFSTVTILAIIIYAVGVCAMYRAAKSHGLESI